MDNPLWVTILVWLHVAGALATLATGPIAMLTRKGGKNHRLAGKIFFWAMFDIFVTAIALLFNRFTIFLLIITVFSFYGALTGYRALYRKKGKADVTLLDRGAAVVTLVAGVTFLIWGAAVLFGLFPSFPAAYGGLGLGFGYIITGMARQDLVSFRGAPFNKRWWWYYHMDRMCGAYIATVTALMVQTVSPRLGDIGWVTWIAPALIGVPLVNYWIYRYRVRFGDVETAVQPTN